MTTTETTEQALRRISTGHWVVFVLDDNWRGDGVSPVEHALRTSRHKATRCSLTVVGKNVAPAMGTRRPCRSCLHSIEHDAAMQIPIPGPDSLAERYGVLARAMGRADEFRTAARALAGMLADAKVHPATIDAVLAAFVSEDTVREVMVSWP